MEATHGVRGRALWRGVRAVSRTRGGCPSLASLEPVILISSCHWASANPLHLQPPCPYNPFPDSSHSFPKVTVKSSGRWGGASATCNSHCLAARVEVQPDTDRGGAVVRVVPAVWRPHALVTLELGEYRWFKVLSTAHAKVRPTSAGGKGQIAKSKTGQTSPLRSSAFLWTRLFTA